MVKRTMQSKARRKAPSWVKPSRKGSERIKKTQTGFEIVSKRGFGAGIIVTDKGLRLVTEQTPPVGYNQFHPVGSLKYDAFIAQAQAAQDDVWYSIADWQAFILNPKRNAKIEALVKKYSPKTYKA